MRVDVDRRDRTLKTRHPPDQKRYIGKILGPDNPEDEDSVVWLDWPPEAAASDDAAARLLVALRAASGKRLTGGNDEGMPNASGQAELRGAGGQSRRRRGEGHRHVRLDEIDDIAIVAMPDARRLETEIELRRQRRRLIRTARRCATASRWSTGRPSSSMNEIRDFRGQFDSKYAALYHPWIEILDPTQRAAQGAPPRRLMLPPSGFVAGIYARSDIERGVHKAPANEVVRGLTRFEININKARQDVLNPEGINALRFFEGRGNRVWGARTMSSDPGMEVRQRAAAVHLPRALDRQGHAVGGVRAEQRAAVAQHPADHRGLPARCCGATARCSAPSPRRRSSCAATAPR